MVSEFVVFIFNHRSTIFYISFSYISKLTLALSDKISSVSDVTVTGCKQRTLGSGVTQI